jgi:hypothetical protein
VDRCFLRAGKADGKRGPGGNKAQRWFLSPRMPLPRCILVRRYLHSPLLREFHVTHVYAQVFRGVLQTEPTTAKTKFKSPPQWQLRPKSRGHKGKKAKAGKKKESKSNRDECSAAPRGLSSRLQLRNKSARYTPTLDCPVQNARVRMPFLTKTVLPGSKLLWIASRFHYGLP